MFIKATVSALSVFICIAGAVAQPPPQVQFDFLKLIQAARDTYATAKNDMQKGAARAMRAKAICALLGSRRVDRWVGTVTELTTNSEGRGVISLDIGWTTVVKTWNNSISDAGDRTMLDPHGKLFSVAAGLNKGDSVVFSGTFVSDDRDCIKEASLTLGGSISAPWFIFRFTDLAKR